MSACTRCLFEAGMTVWLEARALPARLRTITVGADGVCNVCHAFAAERSPAMDALVAEAFIDEVAEGGCVVAYSGGKDSTAALVQARRLTDRVTACLYDNGFIPDGVLAQAEAVCARLDVSLEVARPDASERDAFARAVAGVSRDQASPCERCADRLMHAALACCDGHGARHVVTGSAYWAWWDDAPVAAVDARTPGGLTVSVVHLPYLLSTTRAAARTLLHEVGFVPEQLAGISTNCRVPGLVQLKMVPALGWVPEREDLSLEVIAGHLTREEALAELTAKA